MNFVGKWSLCGRTSRSWAIGPNNFLSGEIRVIHGKMHIIDFGYRQRILMVFLSGEIRVIHGKMHIIDFGYRQGILMIF